MRSPSRAASTTALLAAGALLAALWPLSAYAASPLLLPGTVVVAAAGLATIRRPEVGLAIAIALAPLHRAVLPELPGIQPVKFLVPALACGLVVYSALLARGETPRRLPAVVPAILALAVLTAVSALQGLAAGNSLGSVARVLTAGALALAAWQICRGPRELLVVAAGAITGLAIAGAQGLVQQALGQVSDIGFVADGEAVGRIEGSFGHPNQYAGYLAVLIPLAVSLALSRGVRPWLRALSGVAVGVAVPALTLAYARGAVVGLALGSLVWLAVVRPRAAPPVLALLAAAYLLFAPSVLTQRLENVDTGDVTLRTDLWGAALDIYSEHPLLGVGMENFGNAYANLPANLPTATQRRLLHGNQVLVPPHAANLYLNWLAEEGILGLVALLAVGLLALRAARQATRRPDRLVRAVAVGLCAGLLTFAFHDLLEVTFLDVLTPLAVLTVALGAVTAPRVRPGRHAAAGAA